MSESKTFTAEEIRLIREEVLQPNKRQPTENEVALFVRQCERTGLDPFDRQIYAQFRWDNRRGKEAMAVQATIDGFRVVAERSEKYIGQHGPLWCGPDGKWVDVWVTREQPPTAAKVGVWKTGAKEPTFGVALFEEYAQRGKSGNLIGLWPTMPANQIAKCAEALALRKAFPRQLSGIYTTEEMQQADNGKAAEATADDITAVRELPAPPLPAARKPPETPSEPTPDPQRRPEDLASEDELNALRELIEVTSTAEPFVRMTLIDFGIEDVGTIEEMLPKLSVAQALHVMTRINERMAA